MEGPEEKTGTGVRRELLQFYLNSLLFRLWSISQRTCCPEPPWPWWMAAPLSPSMSPLRESTGWRACWDTKLVWAWHPFCSQRGVLACILTYGTVMGQALDRYRKREHPYAGDVLKGRRSLFITAVKGFLEFMDISILDQIQSKLLKQAYQLVPLTHWGSHAKGILEQAKNNPFRWC